MSPDSGITPSTNDLVGELRALELLAPFSDRDLEAIATVVKPHRFRAEEVIYEERSEGNDFLLITSGELEARRETPVGHQRVATLAAGEVCGEISLLDGRPRSSSVVGTGDGSMLLFDAAGMAELVGRSPEVELIFLRIFCRSLARKIRQANHVMTQIMAPDAAEERVASGKRGMRDSVDEETKSKILREHGMSTSELQKLSAFLEAERFVSGDSIFVEGEQGDTLYIVAEGRVRISRHFPGMGEEALAILDRGEVFGEMAWIDDSPRSADAIAHTGGCTVLGISGEHLDGTLDSGVETHGQFLRLICQVLCRRIRNMNDQLVAYRTMAFF